MMTALLRLRQHAPLLALLALAGVAMHAGHAAAQSLATTFTVGSQRVTGSTWNYDGNIIIGTGPLVSVTVQNIDCDTPPPAPMTAGAMAGVIAWSATLSPDGTAGSVVYTGYLAPSRGGASGSGHVRIIQPVVEPNQLTQVDVTLYNLNQFAQGNLLNVCLNTGQPSPASVGATVAAVMGQVAGFGYDATGLVTTTAADGSLFVGISGVPTGSGSTTATWVFFFRGTTYLGTDTAVASPNGLILTGSPGPGQIDVRYANPNAALPPVTITYTWNGSAVTPGGTPPGH